MTEVQSNRVNVEARGSARQFGTKLFRSRQRNPHTGESKVLIKVAVLRDELNSFLEVGLFFIALKVLIKLKCASTS